MSYRKINTWSNVDWWTIFIYLLLVIAGWFSVYAASYNYYHQTGMMDLSSRAGMQMVWILSSLLIGFSLLMIESDWYEVFSFWIYLIVIFLLILTIFIAPDIKGSRSWLVMGPIRFQSAEFAKFATALAIAKLMSIYKFNLKEGRNLIGLLGIIFFPMVLILLQKETGSALVFLAFFFVLYREGMSGMVLTSGFSAILLFVLAVRYSTEMWGVTPVGEFSTLVLIILFILGLLLNYKKGQLHVKYMSYALLSIASISFAVYYFFPFNLCRIALFTLFAMILYLVILFVKYRASKYLWILLFAILSIGFSYSVDYVFDEILERHQQIRIQVALGVLDDPSGAGYNVNQSKIAIGSGGISGKGFLNGTQTKLKYVPEQDTDFIFCTIGEEKGFFGASMVLLAFFILIIRLIILAERQRSIFHRVYGYSVASIFFFHLAINIGMVIGITPVIGIPLPFFSYGGSSLWAFTILLFIFLRLDASRNARL